MTDKPKLVVSCLPSFSRFNKEVSISVLKNLYMGKLKRSLPNSKVEVACENTTNGSLWIVQVLSMGQHPQKFARWRTKIECFIQHHSPARKLLETSAQQKGPEQSTHCRG
jgi:hypothetical protein